MGVLAINAASGNDSSDSETDPGLSMLFDRADACQIHARNASCQIYDRAAVFHIVRQSKCTVSTLHACILLGGRRRLCNCECGHLVTIDACFYCIRLITCVFLSQRSSS